MPFVRTSTCIRYGMAALLVLMAAVRILHFQPGWSPDSVRVWSQSDALMSGNGFSNGFLDGKPDVHLPPGYAVFVSIARLICDNVTFLRTLQILISLATSAWLYFTVLPTSRRWAMMSVLVTGCSMTVATLAGAVLSETLGMAISTLIVVLLFRSDTSDSKEFLLGCSLISLVLTCPAAGIVAALVYFARLAESKTNRSRLLLTMGCVAVAVPWQVHCFRSVGNIVPFMYETRQDSVRKSGFLHWAKTWMNRPSDFPVIFDHDITRVRPNAFSDERERLLTLRIYQDRLTGQITEQIYQEQFREIGDLRISRNRLKNVWLPILSRSVTLWWEVSGSMPYQESYIGRFDFRTLREDYHEYGVLRTGLRLGKATYSSIMYVEALVIAALLVLAMWVALASRNPVAIAIVLGVIGYTLASAITGYCEVRRNVVFYPLIIAAAAVGEHRRAQKKTDLRSNK